MGGRDRRVPRADGKADGARARGEGGAMTAVTRPPRRGSWLVELLIVIGLIAAFLIVSARLFTTTMRLSQQSVESEARVARLDSAVRMLRADAWGASAMYLDNGGVLMLEVDGRSIAWGSDADGALTRT